MKYFLFFLVVFCSMQITYAKQSKDSLKTYSLGEIVITSKVNEAISSASVLEIGSELENHTGTDISRVFENQPGIFYAPTSKNESKIYMRGFDQADVSVMIDGVPVYQPYDGLVDFSNLPANCFRKIVIDKGMSSVLYGSNAMGGVVNLITKEPLKNFSSEINLETGNANILSAGVSGIHSQFYYSLNGMYSRSGGYKMADEFTAIKNENGDIRDNSQFENKGGMVKLGVNNLFGFNTAYSLMLINNSKGIPVDVYTSKPRYWKFTEWKKTINNLMFSRVFEDKAVIKGNFYHESFYNVLDSYDNSLYAAQTKPFAFHSVYDDYSYGMNFSFAYSFIKEGLTKSYFLYRRDVHQEQGNFNQPFKKYEAADLSCGIEQEINVLQNISSVIGFGYSYLKPLNANGGILRSAVSSLNYNFGIAYKYFDYFTLHAALSYKNRFPVLREYYSETKGLELANPLLNPEYALKNEIGVTFKYSDESSFSIIYFRNDVNDLIKQVPVSGGLKQFQNVGKALFTGVELSTDYSYSNLNAKFSYTYLASENKTENSATDILEYRPKHVISFTASYTFYFNLSLEAAYLYTAKEYGVNLENMNYVSMPDKGILNIMASQQIISLLKVYCKVNNAFDKYYESEFAFPQPGREIIAGCRISM